MKALFSLIVIAISLWLWFLPMYLIWHLINPVGFWQMFAMSMALTMTIAPVWGYICFLLSAFGIMIVMEMTYRHK